MTTEQKTIQQFVQENNIRMTSEQVDTNPHMASDDKWMRSADHWKCKLTRKWTEVYSFRNERGDLVNGHKDRKRAMTVYFSMGSGHNGKAPSAEDVISCVSSDSVGVENAADFADWAYELGLSVNPRVRRTYQACQSQAAKLARFLDSDDLYQELLYEVEPL